MTPFYIRDSRIANEIDSVYKGLRFNELRGGINMIPPDVIRGSLVFHPTVPCILPPQFAF